MKSLYSDLESRAETTGSHRGYVVEILEERGERSTCLTNLYVLNKLTRSVDEERASKPVEEELLYTSCVAQHRRQADHRKQFLSFRLVANPTSPPAMVF